MVFDVTLEGYNHSLEGYIIMLNSEKLIFVGWQRHYGHIMAILFSVILGILILLFVVHFSSFFLFILM